MLLSFEEVVHHVRIGDRELTSWIEQRFVLPLRKEGSYFFDDSDLARLKLIVELRGDLEVNEEALPVVLRLLDRIYGLNHTLEQLRGAIAALPDSCRHELERNLHLEELPPDGRKGRG